MAQSYAQRKELVMYETFYGFRSKPFSLLPDPEFLYLSKKHQMALTLLEYGLMNQASFSVITGDIGTGKTTLIRQLLNQMESDMVVGLITNTIPRLEICFNGFCWRSILNAIVKKRSICTRPSWTS